LAGTGFDQGSPGGSLGGGSLGGRCVRGRFLAVLKAYILSTSVLAISVFTIGGGVSGLLIDLPEDRADAVTYLLPGSASSGPSRSGGAELGHRLSIGSRAEQEGGNGN
jgi:hypothetical protein